MVVLPARLELAIDGNFREWFSFEIRDACVLAGIAYNEKKEGSLEVWPVEYAV